MTSIAKLLLFFISTFLLGILLYIMGLLLYPWFSASSLKSYEPQILFPHVMVDHQIYHGNHVDSTVWKYCVQTNIDDLLEHLKNELPEADIFERDYTFMIYKSVDNFFIRFLTSVYFYPNRPNLMLEAIRSRNSECIGIWYYVTYQVENH